MAWLGIENVSARAKHLLQRSSTCDTYMQLFSTSSFLNSKSIEKSTMITGIPNAYNAVEFERAAGDKWKNRENRKGGSFPTFRMLFPPPNITGKLHLGHALTVAIQDSIARLKFMTGSNVEWIPGFDHAGIATHSVVHRRLQFTSNSNGVQHDTFEKELRNFSKMNQEIITKQLQQLGTLLDWNDVYYTLDENHSKAVREAFIHLFENSSICRANEIINWSCTLESSISDVEVEHVNFDGKTSFLVPGYEKPIDFGLLYELAYPLQNSDQSIIVSTSRPETIFGDVAIAVHPDNPAFSKFIGSNAINPINGKMLPIVGDTKVKLEFGTGAMKITPAHDKNDFAISRSHGLPSIQIFTANGKLNDSCGNFTGLGRFLARSEVVDFLTNNGAMKGICEYKGTIALCSRSNDIIEPMLKPHWFLKTDGLTKTIIQAVEKDEIVIKPDRQKHVFLHVLSQAHDWCLSRQIRWGHAIPAYFHKDFPDKWVAAHDIESAAAKLKEKLQLAQITSEDIRQDPDVLDTWFSSALIPLTVSGWPNTSVINVVTAHSNSTVSLSSS